MNLLRSIMIRLGHGRKLRRAQAEWRAAARAYQAAKQRGDTRSQHLAQRAARDKVHACLRLERAR